MLCQVIALESHRAFAIDKPVDLAYRVADLFGILAVSTLVQDFVGKFLGAPTPSTVRVVSRAHRLAELFSAGVFSGGAFKAGAFGGASDDLSSATAWCSLTPFAVAGKKPSNRLLAR